MPESLLSVRNLAVEAKVFPANQKPRWTRIVEGVSFSLEKGRVIGLIGESGAGKSTIGLASLLYSRRGVRRVAGEILFDGENYSRPGGKGFRKHRGRKVCYVAQSAAASFNPAFRIMRQVVESSLDRGRFDRRKIERKAESLFALLGLPEPEKFGDRYPHQVSGGQLQRAMTAMALCPGPDLIVFDEPTTALDVTTQIEVLKAIKNAIREKGVAAIYISHDLAVVAQIADDIMVLKNGRTVEYGKTEKILEQPAEDYTKELISARALKHAERSSAERPILRVEAVEARFKGAGESVLSGVSFEVQKGRTTAVVGESGSGKTTLAKVVAGLMQPLRGRVLLDGKRLRPDFSKRSKEELRKVQMIFQTPDVSMNPRQKIESIVGRPLEFYFKVKGGEKRRRVAELLEAVELPGSFAGRYPAELSGGQKQRVCLARALAAEPEIIICDEITSALDPLISGEIMRLLLALQKEKRVAYLFITHDLGLVKAVADSVIVMLKGKIVRQGNKTKVLSPPLDNYTAKLISSIPEMEPGWLESRVGGDLPGSGGSSGQKPCRPQPSGGFFPKFFPVLGNR